jgi:hypothetical protein
VFQKSYALQEKLSASINVKYFKKIPALYAPYMHKLKLHIYKSQHLLTVWPGKVQQWLALSLFLLVVLVLQMCCSFLILLLSEHSSGAKAYVGDHSRNVPTYCTGQTTSHSGNPEILRGHSRGYPSGVEYTPGGVPTLVALVESREGGSCNQ